VGASKLANQTSLHSDAFYQLQRRRGALISLFLAAEVREAIAQSAASFISIAVADVAGGCASARHRACRNSLGFSPAQQPIERVG
jgi:hypothetical protein